MDLLLKSDFHKNSIKTQHFFKNSKLPFQISILFPLNCFKLRYKREFKQFKPSE